MNNSDASSSWSFRDESIKKISHQNLGDRLPIPATIAALEQSLTVSGEDSYVLGDVHFRTVLTVGVIQEKTETEDKTIYTLHDPEDTADLFKVFQFGDSDNGGSKFIKKGLQEDMRVRVIGKLSHIAGEKAILAYLIDQVTNDKDFEIFKLEARASQLFFGKNFIEKMRRGDTHGWNGMLAPPAIRKPEREHPTARISISSSASTSTSTHHIIKSGPSPKSNTPQAMLKKVNACIRSQEAEYGNGETHGVPFDCILRKVGSLPEQQLRQILSEMEEKGMIYAANTDEWMSIH